jgi:hypothetical protein
LDVAGGDLKAKPAETQSNTEIASDHYQCVLHLIRYVNKTLASNTQVYLVSLSVVRDILENFVDQALKQPELDVQTFGEELLWSACWDLCIPD